MLTKVKRLRDDRNLSTYPISRRDYYCVECGISYRLNRERIVEDKPSHITFTCDICLDNYTAGFDNTQQIG